MKNVSSLLSTCFLSYALYFLVSCGDGSTQEPGSVGSLPPGREQAAEKLPLIKFREVTLGDPSPSRGDWKATITDTIYAKYSIGNWDLSRLRTYVDMLKAFDFNSIQLYDNWQRYSNAGWMWPRSEIWPRKADPRDWPEKMDALADYARSQGFRTTLHVWGNTAFDYRNNTVPPYLSLDPDAPVAMQILEQYWDHLAEHAPHFDHFVTHWGDPGGCKGEACTIEAAQNFHNEIVRRFRKKNPAIQSTFSLWMLHTERFKKWAGYKDAHTILDSGILPADVMVAVDGNGGRINLSEVAAIDEAGRKVGVWGWYLADHEVVPSLWVRTSRLAEAFRELLPKAHTPIEWYSVDSNSHGLNMQNLYVAGKLMRDPGVDAQAALREFVTGAFGAQNVERVEKVFRTVERTRRSANHERDLADVREAHKLSLQISIPEGFKPAFPMVISPQELAEELVAQTEAMVQFLEFSAAASKVEEMRKQEAAQDQIEVALAKLPKVEAPSEWLTGLEYVMYRRKLDELGGEEAQK